MPGRGPAPKPAHRRAHRGGVKDPPYTNLEFEPAEAPELPDVIDWHPQTLVWWEHLRESPLAKLMMVSDWDFMLDTAVLHTRFWDGDMKVAAEIRLRVAKLGVTPEDRLRLRIQAVQADEADAKRPKPSAGGRYSDLQVVADAMGV